MKIAAIAAFAVLVALTPARAADVATANDTARFLAGMPPSADSPLTPLTKDPSWQRHARFFDETFGAARAEPDFQDPGLGRRQSGRAAADDVLHVQRPGLPLCGRVLFQGDDLCTERARTVRSGARRPEAAAWRRRARALLRRTFAGIDPAPELFHHQADEGRPAGRRGQRHPANPLRLPGALGQDHPQRRSGRARRQWRGSSRQRRRRQERDARRAHHLRRQRQSRNRRCIFSAPTFRTAASRTAAS